MAYDVVIERDVAEYIAALALSPDDQATVLREIVVELSENADKFLIGHPLAHESLCFRYDYAHPTYETMFAFEFIVDASHSEMGVMRVVFVECTTSPMRDPDS